MWVAGVWKWVWVYVEVVKVMTWGFHVVAREVWVQRLLPVSSARPGVEAEGEQVPKGKRLAVGGQGTVG